MLALGIDIGGSGIKGAIVDTAAGTLVTERLRVPTPKAPDAKAVPKIIRELAMKLDWKKGPVGIGFPGVIRENVIHTAVNLHPSLVGVNLAKAVDGHVTGPVRVINDADAAGVAEMRYGAGKPHAAKGTVLVLTVGTGIGSALFRDGLLVPNLELGHIEYNGRHAETFLSERARKRDDLSWGRWGRRFNGFLAYLEFLLQPDLIIIGGGGIKRTDKFGEHITIRTPWAFASAGNRAGMIGAAVNAAG